MSFDPHHCPETEVLTEYHAGHLSEADLSAVAYHLEKCPHCLEVLEGMDDAADPLIGELRKPARTDSVTPDECRRVVERVELLCREPVQMLDLAGRPGTPGRVGPYQVLECLGEGGMGAVYKARHTHLGKIVALKLLPAERLSKSAVARFLLEMKAVGRLDHPNIVQAYDASADGTPYLAMEFLEGADLGKLVKRHGPLAFADACDVIRQAALGLQHAHEHGLVHRDLKPQNLMLTPGGVVKVLDLGLARLRPECGWQEKPPAGAASAPPAVVGTVDYIAPEQLLNCDGVDIRADLYSLGCTLYHLLTGRPPFAGPQQTSFTKQQGHLLELAPPVSRSRPDVPPGLSAVLSRLLAKAPADRFATPAELATALQPYTAGCCLRGLLRGDTALLSAPPFGASTGASATALLTPAAAGVGGRPPVPETSALSWVLTVGLAAFTAVLFWAGLSRLLAPDAPAGPPLAVESLEAHQFRAADGGDFYAGELGRHSAAAGANEDSVRVSARLSEPAYFYLVAFNPDGTAELCSPAAEDLPPELAAAVTFPPAGRRRPLKDRGVGLTALVLAASRQPLPAYGRWKAERGTPPWAPAHADGVWRFDGRQFRRMMPGRGDGGGSVPPALAQLCYFFQNQPGIDAVSALAFPVRAQVPPLDALPTP
jgi:hypothetical protein